jgi:transcriptional regulator with XRE-family HTH domain
MPSEITVRFGERVRKLRKRKGFAQEGFAAHCQVDRSYMGSIERGEVSPTLDTILKIATGLGVTLAQLFRGM